MKYLLPIFILFVLIGCKNDPKKDKVEIEVEHTSDEISDTLRVSDGDLEQQERFLNLKRRELIEKKDQKEELENLVISKSYFNQGDKFTIDFEYPYLNQKIKPSYENFNEYISKHYLDIKGVEKQIMEEKRLCDSLGIPHANEKRIVEYKIYNPTTA